MDTGHLPTTTPNTSEEEGMDGAEGAREQREKVRGSQKEREREDSCRRRKEVDTTAREDAENF